MDDLSRESPCVLGVDDCSNGEVPPSANGKRRRMSTERRRRKPNTLDIDYIVNDIVGTCGLWQWAVIIVGSFAVPCTVTFPVFGNTEPLHRCKMNATVEAQLTNVASLSNFSSRDQFNLIAATVGPWKANGSSRAVNEGAVGCKQFVRNWDELSVESMLTSNNSVYPTEPCRNGYVYHFTDYQYPGGIVAEWDLVCTSAWKVPFGTSAYMVGMLVGFLAGGLAGDKFGRRPTALFACVLDGLSSIAVALAPNYWVYILSRGLLASATTIKIAVILVLMMELTVASQRSLFNSFWSFVQGFILRALISPLAFFLHNWRWLHAAITIPTTLSFPFIWFFPESPRWLVSQKLHSEALHELYTGYRVNSLLKFRSEIKVLTEAEFCSRYGEECRLMRKTEKEPIEVSGRTAGKSCSQTCSQLVPSLFSPANNRRLFLVTLQCILLFFGQIATTFGLLFYGRSIHADIYLINFWNSACQLPATVISGLLYRLCKKRKLPIAVLYTIACVILLAASLFEILAAPESDLVLNICCNLALILLSASLNMLFMYVPELFPSEVRTQGLGLAAGIGRLGGVLCPFVNTLDSYVLHGLPVLVYAVILLIQLANLAKLPDTSGQNLPDNVWSSQAENIGASVSTISHQAAR
ncbi:hypothetical protein SprV_0200875700 [Sparganum proliferum]